MDDRAVILEIDAGIACITLNRPEKLNVLSGDMLAEWDRALRFCDSADEVRVVIVTGMGKAFCAGADISGGSSTWDVQEDMGFSSCPITPAYKLKKPVIAAVNGHAIGVGFSLAMQCDFRIVALEGRYALPQVQYGVLGDGNMHWLLPRLVGMEKALRLHLLGEKLDGAGMVDMGLAGKAVPADEVLGEAQALARQLVEKSSPLIAGLAKQLCWQSWDRTADQMEVLETKVLHYTMGRPDAVEGGTAFAERRAPQWTSAVPRDWPENWPDHWSQH